MQVRKKLGKSRNIVFFPMFCGSGGCGAIWAGRIAHQCGAKQIWKSKCYKHLSLRTPFGPRCRKSAHPCGAKRISKSKWAKHTILGALLEVEISKKRTLFWRKAHFEVNICARCSKSGAKHISKSKCNKHTPRTDHSGPWDVQKSARPCGAKLHYTTTPHYTTLH